MKASIVIPVYNTGILLHRMLDSVLAQTEKDFELICVDDGSTDGSDSVVEEYAARDNRVRLIRQKNQGPYVARSTGLLAATGDYVYICDHDDRMHPQLLEFCIYELEKKGLDIIVFGHDNRMEQGDFEMPPIPPFESIAVDVLSKDSLESDRERYIADLCNVHIDQWAHVAKLELAQSVLCQSDYNLPRTLDLIKRADKWGWTTLKLYYYNVGNPGSLIKKAPTKKNILDLHTEIVGMIDLFKEERNSGDTYGVWDAICRTYLIPNVKIMYNMIRRGKKALKAAGRLNESYRLFSIFLYDIFVRRGIPLKFARFRHRIAYRWLMFKYRPDLDQSREGLTARILSNKSRFEAMMAKLASLEGDDEIINGALEALGFQMGHSTGYYSSNAIEDALQKVARRHTVPLADKYRKDSVLHVMTQYLPVGGHTRVVERWIGRAPKNECHSVAVLTPPDFPPPKALIENVGIHGGEIVLFEANSFVDKALKLRKLASAFDRVVLHVNCEDIIPILAFGTEEFRRPVLLFNHADHMFGLGVSIADAFLDLRMGGASLSINCRDVRNSHIVHIPCDNNAIKDRPKTKEEKLRMREQLGLPYDKQIIVTAASAYKYRPFLDWNFVDYMEKILGMDDNCEFVVIGPKSVNGSVAFRNRIHAVGIVNPKVCMQYFSVADLVVDSFPFMSFTSIQDAISMGVPTLSLKTLMPHLDWVQSSDSYANDMDELISKTRRILTDGAYAKEVLESATKYLRREQDLQQWAKELQSAYGSACCHSIHKFKSSPMKHPDVLDMFLESKNLHVKNKLRFWRFNVISYVEDGRKRHSIAFLPNKCKIREFS